jgi:hypothetical protein
MNLDARNGDSGWFVWRCDTCQIQKRVIWVDTELARWGECIGICLQTKDMLIAERQEKAIRILPESRTVLINPRELPEEVQNQAEVFG